MWQLSNCFIIIIIIKFSSVLLLFSDIIKLIKIHEQLSWNKIKLRISKLPILV